MNGAGALVALLDRTASGDIPAFRGLYEATSAKLFGVVLRILHERGEAEDVLQEVYTTVWRKAAEFDSSRASPITWMATIARNRALDEFRRQKVMPSTDIDHEVDLASDAEDALDAMERTDTLKALLQCLNSLEKDRRDLVLLAYYRGLSREDLAQRSGRPVATVKTWLHRSLAQLRVCLAR